jgi:hypothetical protein
MLCRLCSELPTSKSLSILVLLRFFRRGNSKLDLYSGKSDSDACTLSMHCLVERMSVSEQVSLAKPYRKKRLMKTPGITLA